MRWVVVFVIFAISSALWACGSTGSAGPSVDAGSEATVVADSGGDAGPQGPAPFPAFVPAMPAIINHGGPVLTAPKFVTVTWQGDGGDPLGQGYEGLAANIGSSDYWKNTTTEYGVGTATAGTPVRIMDPPPATIDGDTGIPAFIRTQLAGAPGNGWPVPDANTVYVLYMPPTTMVTSQGDDECSFGIGGYHDETFSATNSHVIFAVVLQCAGGGRLFDETCASASHEMVEAATDPHTQSDRAWTGIDLDTYYAWDLWQADQTEVGDMCEAFDQENYSDPFGFYVQRMWSNASALGGHDPCVPVPATAAITGPPTALPYFNTTPLGLEDIVIKPVHGSSPTTKAKGYSIPVGTSRTIQLGFYSDGAFPAWNFGVLEEGGPFTGPAPTEVQTTITLDRTAGGNGDIANVTIKVNKLTGTDSSILLTAFSQATADGPKHYMPIVLTGK